LTPKSKSLVTSTIKPVPPVKKPISIFSGSHGDKLPQAVPLVSIADGGEKFKYKQQLNYFIGTLTFIDIIKFKD
jgi:hypothetical protein